MYYCDQSKCNYKSKYKHHLKRHMANIHDIGVTWHNCDQEGCDYKCKNKESLKCHKANIHNIGVTLFKCDINNCMFKCKLKGYLKLSLGTKDIETELNNNEAKIKIKNEIPKEAEERLKSKIIELIPNIKKVDFTIGQQKNK